MRFRIFDPPKIVLNSRKFPGKRRQCINQSFPHQVHTKNRQYSEIDNRISRTKSIKIKNPLHQYRFCLNTQIFIVFCSPSSLQKGINIFHFISFHWKLQYFNFVIYFTRNERLFMYFSCRWSNSFLRPFCDKRKEGKNFFKPWNNEIFLLLLKKFESRFYIR